MLALLADSGEVILLEWVVGLTVGLALLGSLLYVGLFVARLIQEKHNRYDSRREEELADAIFGALYADGEPPTLASLPRRRDVHLLQRAYIAIISHLRGNDRQKAAALLRESGLAPSIYDSAVSTKADWREEAARLLKHFQTTESYRRLEWLLEDPVYAVRLQAAHSLVMMERVNDLKDLLERLAPEEMSASLMLSDLFHSLQPKLLQQALTMLDKDINHEWKVYFIHAFGERDIPDAAQTLVQHLDDPEESVRAACWQSLYRLDDPIASEYLERGLNDTSPDVRSQAANCAGMLKDTRFASQLELLLMDPDWWVRFRAALALYNMKKTGQAILRKAAERKEEPQRTIAEQVLREHGQLKNQPA